MTVRTKSSRRPVLRSAGVVSVALFRAFHGQHLPARSLLSARTRCVCVLLELVGNIWLVRWLARGLLFSHLLCTRDILPRAERPVSRCRITSSVTSAAVSDPPGRCVGDTRVKNK